MTSNTQTSLLMRWSITLVDFSILNLLVWLFAGYHPLVRDWAWELKWVFLLCNNLSLLFSELRFPPVVHRRMVSVSDILRRIVCLVLLQALSCYVLLKAVSVHIPSGRVMLMLLPPLLLALLASRFLERLAVKRFRSAGRNSRSVTFVGSDPELHAVYDRLCNDPTRGYRFLGYYADGEPGGWTHTGEGRDADAPEADAAARPPLERLGTLQDFLQGMQSDPDGLSCGDELYVSLSRRERDVIRRISSFCDRRLVRFYYVPVSVESLGMSMKKEFLDDVEVFTTYDIPLASPVNKAVKRLFDVAASLAFLVPTAVLFPFIWLAIKVQSPGPVFFRQRRTGLDGREFEMLKFRSMHVNADADRVQATEDDPRKFPFGDFMRRSNIDELPQFLNVLRGSMSFVGPRPHMLAHTEQYSRLIDKYMVRHFVKPGLTGWAQVTGFRGETRELWQMEGRVRRDIWYIEHWSIWLDIRIIWLTAKTIFIHDRNAY